MEWHDLGCSPGGAWDLVIYKKVEGYTLIETTVLGHLYLLSWEDDATVQWMNYASPDVVTLYEGTPDGATDYVEQVFVLNPEDFLMEICL